MVNGMNMKMLTLVDLLDSIGEIDDFFLEEAEAADFVVTKARTNRKIVRYGAAGLAVSVGMAMAYWLLKPNRGSKMAG